MSKRIFDIEDDEIRIISSPNKPVGYDRGQEKEDVKKTQVPTVPKSSYSTVNSRRRHRAGKIIALIAVCAILLYLASLLFAPEPPDTGNAPRTSRESHCYAASVPDTDAYSKHSYTVYRDSVVNGVKLQFLTPHNSIPTLEIRNDAILDPYAVLAVQAADVREDNGEIAGAFVVNGELVSKGESKSGFCSIINGQITIGVADATPMLEEALTSHGYFFRQYPLVVGGQIVENRPKGKAIRKALVEDKDGISVVMSEDRLTFHDFSQALVDAGVRNAIYLVGGNSLGCYTDSEGKRVAFGKKWENYPKNENYIVWR